MVKIAGLFFILSLSAVMAYGQKDPNKGFEKSKGTWDYPVEHGTLIPYDKYAELIDGFKSCTFHTDSTAAIHALFEGRVITIFSVDTTGEYTMLTRFGNYTICYDGLQQPVFKKGDYIKAGQTIGYPSKDLDGNTRIRIILMHKEEAVDVSTWFKPYVHLTK